MSAGIVSACLPTFRPVIQWAARGVGMKGGLFGNSEHDSAAFSKNLTRSANKLRSNPDVKDADFYRLPDGGASGQSREPAPADATLRPAHGYAYAITTTPGHRKGDNDSLSSGDEIPLQGIRVQKDFQHSG
jgi:hypothetical protein